MIYKIIQRFLDWKRGNLGGLRSGKWNTIRKQFLKLNPDCAVCGKSGIFLKPIEVHHIIPVSQDKTRELVFENFISVCREHHYFVAHLNSWKSYNKDILEDAKYWRNKIATRP